MRSTVPLQLFILKAEKSPGFPIKHKGPDALAMVVLWCEQWEVPRRDMDNSIQISACPILVSQLPRRCPASYKIRGIYGASTGHIRDIYGTSYFPPHRYYTLSRLCCPITLRNVFAVRASLLCCVLRLLRTSRYLNRNS
jgi:hypothetical protein